MTRQTAATWAKRPIVVEVVEAQRADGRVPPHDLDSEAAVLAAVLLESRALDQVMPLLKPEQMYSDANRAILGAAYDLKQEGSPVDITTVAAWLRSRDLINQIGGPSYLVQLVDATPSVANVVAHTHIVAEKHRLRQFIGACQQAAAEGYGPITGTVDDFIGQLDQSIRELLRRAPGRQQAQSLSTIIKSAMDKASENSDRRAAGLASREIVESRFALFDQKLVGGGFMRGNFYVIGARPGMGKTAWAGNVAMNICEQPTIETDPAFSLVEHSAFFWSGEMPREQLGMRLVCSESGVDFDRAMRGDMTPDEWQVHTGAAEWVSNLPIVVEDKANITMSELEAKAREARAAWERPADPARQQRERRFSAIFVDYLTLMQGTGREGNREQEVAGISKGLKRLAKELDVPVIALAQLSRTVASRGEKDHRPGLTDLRESGQIEQDADFVGFLHRPEYYNPGNELLRHIAELNFAKQRNGISPASIPFWFNGPRMRFFTPTKAQMGRIAEAYEVGRP